MMRLRGITDDEVEGGRVRDDDFERWSPMMRLRVSYLVAYLSFHHENVINALYELA